MRWSLFDEILTMSWDTIRGNKLRSFLTVLGIVIGITSIVGMTALIRGFDQSFRDLIKGLGADTIMVAKFSVVSERTREIGLRKALGARRRDILYQILTESVTLSTFGGIVGTLLGFSVAQVISKLTPLPAAVQVWAVVLGIGITAVVGLFFGMYPAMRASRLDPIEALRRE